ncbi:MAG TPA: AI-2E family transporter [Geobacteraceae bacterium]|nr:AI-2E family transporter [Geobacteraceae bacterium]
MTTKQPVATTILLLLLLTAILFAGGYALRHTVSSFLFSFVLAYLVDPFVVMLERRKIRRLYGIVVLYAILGIIGFFIFIFLVPFVNINWYALLADLPKYVQKGKEILLGMAGTFQPAYGTEEWSWLFDKITDSMDTILSKVGSGVYAAVGRVVFNLLNIILAPILVFFMLFYKGDIIAGITGWLPSDRRDSILEVGREINASVGGYIRGQLVVSLIVALLSAIALFFLDIDYPVLNGIFAGMASILPFVGVILATIPPLFFAYVKFQSGIMLVKVLAAFAVIYFIEGYLVKPLVFKKSMDLNPLATIIVVMAFGELMGFWGILLALPIAAAMKITTSHVRRGHFTREPEP